MLDLNKKVSGYEKLMAVITEGDAGRLADAIIRYPITIDNINAAAECMASNSERGVWPEQILRCLRRFLARGKEA